MSALQQRWFAGAKGIDFSVRTVIGLLGGSLIILWFGVTWLDVLG